MLSDKPFSSELRNAKYTLFDQAMYYIEMSEYMLGVGNSDKSLEMAYKHDALMGVIVSVGWEEEYKSFAETGELK